MEAIIEKNTIIEISKLTSMDHPGNQYTPDIETPNTPVQNPSENLILYTDASKMGIDCPVGLAVVADKPPTLENIYQDSLEAKFSVFDGELKAIQEAVRYANENLAEDQEVRIRSDSLSSILALQDPKNRDTRVVTMKKVMENMLQTRNIKTKIEWVRAHVGLLGNEKADEAAKEATRLDPSEVSAKLSKTQIKHRLRRISLAEWQLNWNTSTTGRFTHKIYPTVTTDLKFDKICKTNEQKLLLKAASGHFPTNDLLKRMKLRTNDSCPYCKHRDSITHVLTECSRFSGTRSLYTRTMVTPPEINIINMFTNDRLLQLSTKILKTRIGECNPRQTR